MNRIAAILLLPLMVIFAMQPVIALHYCGGELQSFNLLHQQNNTVQNRLQTEATVSDNYHTCCETHHAQNSDSNIQQHISNDGCCETEVIELTTDDFQKQSELQISRHQLFSFDNPVATLTGLSKLSVPETNTQPPLEDFPPGGLFLKDINLLTYICIYRI